MTQEWDEATWTQWAYFNDGGGLISFDNEAAICAKTEFVQQHNLNGFIIWELSGVSRCLLSPIFLSFFLLFSSSR